MQGLRGVGKGGGKRGEGRGGSARSESCEGGKGGGRSHVKRRRERQSCGRRERLPRAAVCEHASAVVSAGRHIASGTLRVRLLDRDGGNQWQSVAIGGTRRSPELDLEECVLGAPEGQRHVLRHAISMHVISMHVISMHSLEHRKGSGMSCGAVGMQEITFGEMWREMWGDVGRSGEITCGAVGMRQFWRKPQ